MSGYVEIQTLRQTPAGFDIVLGVACGGNSARRAGPIRFCPDRSFRDDVNRFIDLVTWSPIGW